MDHDARPPIAPLAGAAVSHELLTLEAADGNRFAAFAAAPATPSQTGVVVLPDVRGLFGFYEELALRLAEQGVHAVAFDYFGRTAGISERDGDFEYMDHVMQTTAEGVQADTGATIARLREQGARDVYTVGFCFGGRHSWLATAAHELAGAVGFYGLPGPWRDGTPGPTQRAGELRGPILAIMAGADHVISLEAVADFDEALDAAGVEHEVVTYDGAPHSFFDRSQDEYAAAAQDAWRRTLEFIGAAA